MFQRLKNALFGRSEPEHKPVEGVYQAGEIYGFRTRPFHDFNTAETGRYGVLKILGVKPTKIGEREETCVCYVVLDGVFASMPTPPQILDLPILRLNRFAYTNTIAATRIGEKTENTLEEFTFVTFSKMTDHDKKVLDSITSWGGLGTANTDVDLEWRWRNDREQLIADNKADDEIRKKEQQAYKAKRKANRNLDRFSKGDLFDDWRSDLPDGAVKGLEGRFSKAAILLQSLGAKPKRGDARKVLKAMVEGINDLNVELGGFIETIHREHLCELIDDMAYAAKQPKLIDEVDDWRDW